MNKTITKTWKVFISSALHDTLVRIGQRRDFVSKFPGINERKLRIDAKKTNHRFKDGSDFILFSCLGWRKSPEY